MMKYGIDFGTTNSVVSFNDGETVSILPIDPFKEVAEIMPSIWFFDYEVEGWFLGKEAFATYLAHFGEGRLIQSLKRHLANSHLKNTYIYSNTFAQNNLVKLEDLVMIFLQELKQRADRIVGADVKNVVIGKPVNFSNTGDNEVALSRIRYGAEKAGFNNVEFVYEPIAATYSLELKNRIEVNIITIDIGGGTTDISVVRTKPASSEIGQILSTEGLSFGGIDFDSKIMRYKLLEYFGDGLRYDNSKGVSGTFPRPIFSPLTDRYKIFTLINNRKYLGDIKTHSYGIIDPENKLKNLDYLIKEQKGLEVFEAIEGAKKKLSLSDKTTIEYKSGPLKINESITRVEFEGYISEYITKTKDLIFKSLKNSNLQRENIAVVSLTGGSSQIPIFLETVKKIFPQADILKSDIMTNISYGLSKAPTKF